MSRRATNPVTTPPAVAPPVSAAVCGNVVRGIPLKYEIQVAAIHPTYNYRDIDCNDWIPNGLNHLLIQMYVQHVQKLSHYSCYPSHACMPWVYIYRCTSIYTVAIIHIYYNTWLKLNRALQLISPPGVSYVQMIHCPMDLSLHKWRWMLSWPIKKPIH